MRTIEFRGRYVDNHEWKWAYGYVDATMYKDIVVIHTENSTFAVDPESVGQYTGIIDGKGNMIYEGDIIEVALWHNKEVVSKYYAVVEQKEGAFGFKNEQGFCPFYGQIHENYKVIGNIYDDPAFIEIF